MILKMNNFADNETKKQFLAEFSITQGDLSSLDSLLH